MSKYIGVIFSDEAKADEGSRVLKDLHVAGNIALSGMAVVVKDAAGALLVKKSVDEEPLGMAAGALIGGLAGLPGGPVGVVIGATGGALVGRAADLINLGDLTNFFDKVSRELPPGNTAVVAEVSEHSGTSLCDTRMQAIGGTIVREETRSRALPAAAHAERLRHRRARVTGAAMLGVTADGGVQLVEGRGRDHRSVEEAMLHAKRLSYSRPRSMLRVGRSMRRTPRSRSS